MTGLKKNLPSSVEARRRLIDRDSLSISLSRQCELLDLNRSSLYYHQHACFPEEEDLKLMNLIDRQYLETPFYGSRRMGVFLSKELQITINRKRVQRLMRLMGIEAIYPRPNTSRANEGHQKYPYLLRNLAIVRSNQVWSTDITYVRLEGGFAYLVAVMDWFSRMVLSWRLSNTMGVDFCVAAANQAFRGRKPEIFNSDQGSQFTSDEFIKCLRENSVQISMDGRGRALDNVFIERLWRSVKYEDIYIRGYRTLDEADQGLAKYFDFYNHRRPHQSLGYKTPSEIFYA